ncbi:MAG: hypothetical protein IK142_08325, partial [Clostridiales bacterium]|nr:hypothetical protein [Clostridiales bacterium]
MNNKLVFMGKVIALLGAILLASCVFAIGVYNYRDYTRTHLFDIYSPDGLYALIVTRIGQYDGYAERDEVALIDAEGHRNAVFVINMSSETLSSDSFEIAWDADGVEIYGKGSNFALRVSYDDVEGRNIGVSNHNRNFMLVKAFLAVFFCFVIGM